MLLGAFVFSGRGVVSGRTSSRGRSPSRGRPPPSRGRPLSGGRLPSGGRSPFGGRPNSEADPPLEAGPLSLEADPWVLTSGGGHCSGWYASWLVCILVGNYFWTSEVQKMPYLYYDVGKTKTPSRKQLLRTSAPWAIVSEEATSFALFF